MNVQLRLIGSASYVSAKMRVKKGEVALFSKKEADRLLSLSTTMFERVCTDVVSDTQDHFDTSNEVSDNETDTENEETQESDSDEENDNETEEPRRRKRVKVQGSLTKVKPTLRR